MHTIEQGDMTKDLGLLVGRGTLFLDHRGIPGQAG